MFNKIDIKQAYFSALIVLKALFLSTLSILVFQFSTAQVGCFDPIDHKNITNTTTFDPKVQRNDNDMCAFNGGEFSLTCAGDLIVQLSENDVDMMVVNYPFPVLEGVCDTELVLNDNLFLTSGLLPGSDFPVGITPVYFDFVNDDVTITCNFFITVLPFYGCTNPAADNFNEFAIQDDGSCFILDCPGYSGAEVVTFEKENFADWVLEENQDRIADNVWLTRQNNQGLFNIFDQTGYSGMVGGPSNTEWRAGSTNDMGPYTTWVGAANNNPADNCNFNSVMALKISDTDTYFDVTWHSFSGSNTGGGFYYTRTLNIELSGCETSTPLGCTDENACNYDPNAFYDDGSCFDTFTYYSDTDMDGFGDENNFILSCEMETPDGFVADNTDCNDDNNTVFPGAIGTSQGLDNDCNGVVEDDEITCLGDFDGDGMVNAADLLGFLSSFGCSASCYPYDLTGENLVNAADLLVFLSVFGNSCE